MNRDKSITGTTEPETIVRLILPDSSEILSKGDENGRFEIQLPADYKLKVGEELQLVAISGKVLHQNLRLLLWKDM